MEYAKIKYQKKKKEKQVGGSYMHFEFCISHFAFGLWLGGALR